VEQEGEPEAHSVSYLVMAESYQGSLSYWEAQTSISPSSSEIISAGSIAPRFGRGRGREVAPTQTKLNRSDRKTGGFRILKSKPQNTLFIFIHCLPVFKRVAWSGFLD